MCTVTLMKSLTTRITGTNCLFDTNHDVHKGVGRISTFIKTEANLHFQKRTEELPVHAHTTLPVSLSY